MKRSIFLLISAVFSGLVAVSSLFIPEQIAAGFGMIPSPEDVFLMREIGAFSLATFLLNFLARNEPDSKALKVILIFNMAYHLVMGVLNILGMAQGIFTLTQMLPVMVIHLFIGLGSYLYMRKIK